MQITVDLSRLLSELETLASFSDAPAPAVTRVVFSAQDLAARTYLRKLFSEAALEVRTDAVGNTFARWTGTDPSLAPVATGSHTDAVPHAGRYDGTVGVLGGLEAIRALQRGGFRPRRSIELLVFTSEEPTRFGIGCLGSRMLSGTLSPENARLLKDGEGKSLEQILRQAALHGSVEVGSVKDGSLENVRLAKDYYHAFVELHIEQGPLLERKGIPVGIVTAIAAPAALRVTIEGAGGHAGAVLMPDRRDAFLAAAEIALAVESAAKATRSVDSVATTGVCNVFPGAVNSIPSRAVLEIDVRDIDLARRDGMLSTIRAACETVAAKRQVRVEVESDQCRRAGASEPVNHGSALRIVPGAWHRIQCPWSAGRITIRCSCLESRPLACSSFPAATALATGPTNTPPRKTSSVACKYWRPPWLS